MSQKLRFLFVGDVVGQPGITMFQRWIPKLKEEHALDAIIVNGENAAKNGKGLTPKIIDFFRHTGADVITTGNHVWEHREVYTALNERNDVIRPANYPPGCPGKGLAFFSVLGHSVAVINLHGRVFIRDMLDCPFRAVESLLTFVSSKTNLILLDFHAEATSEKRAMGAFLDGKISALVGTHTHVQTADEQILPQGTGFITDVGSCSSINSILGMHEEQVVQRFLYHPYMGRFVVETKGPIVLCGVIIDIDTQTGKTVHIQRVRVEDDTIAAHVEAE